MRIISGYLVYRVYVSYKAHFSSNTTNISKYNFKLFKTSYSAFLDTRGKQYYDKIAKKIKYEADLVNLFIAIFVEDPQTWIGDIWLNINHYIDLKNKRENRISNIQYLFKKDCINMMNKGLKFDTSMAEFVFNEFMHSNIELETFIIFKEIFNFDLDNNTTFSYIYRVKYEKYELLLNIDLDKYKIIIKEIMMTYRD